MKVEVKGKKHKPATVKELKDEIIRLEECLKAYETADAKVLRVEFFPVEGHLFPRIIITAPCMDEEQIAKHACGVYFLYAETLKALMPKEDRDDEARYRKDEE